MTRLDLEFRDGLSPGVAAMIKRAEDLSPAMQAIADHMESSVRGRFLNQTGPDGKRWIPSKRVLEEGGETLNFEGHLLGSIDRAFGPNSATVGTNIEYARIQQLGGTITPRPGKKALKTPFGYRKSVNLPARPFIGFSTEDETEIYEILRRHLEP